MICGCDTDTANMVLLLIGYPATLIFVVTYGVLQPWWRSPWGRAIFVHNIGLSALFGANLFYRAYSWELLAREGWLRVAIYAFVTLGSWLTLIALIVTLVRVRRQRKESA